MEKSHIAVLGLGNIFLQDEGVGVHVANILKQSYSFVPGIEIIDGGTLGIDLLPYFENNDKIIIIDAVDFGNEPGYIGVIENEEILHTLSTIMSSHYIGLVDILRSAKLLEIEPSEICLIGIQPESTATGMELSVKMAGIIKQAVSVIIDKLKEWNIKCDAQASDISESV